MATIPNAPLEAVQTFVTVVEQGSFSAAARALRLPKSSISRRIAQLEQHLSATLLQRTTRKLHLTEVGASYFERCRRALNELSQAERCVEQTSDRPRGVLRLSAPPNFGATMLGPVVQRYVETYPEVQMFLDLSNRHVDLVGEGYDLAIRGGRLADSTLIVRKLLNDGLNLVASPKYLERRGIPKRLQELSQHDCLLFQATGFAATWQLTGPKGLESVPVTGRVTATDIGFIDAAARAGAGIALLPGVRTAEAQAAGELQRILPQYETDSVPLSIVTPKSAYFPPKTKAFIELAIEMLARGAKRRTP